MNLSEEKIESVIDRELPDFQPMDGLQLLRGGNLNYVWRWKGKGQNLIVKIAPPYIASNPDVPLSPQRISFEAKALQLFQDENPLAPLRSEEIGPPKLLFFDPEKHLLVMEDVGNLPHLGQVFPGRADSTKAGAALGHFIGRLHKQTYQNSTLAKDFHNADVQHTRLEVQYKSAADYALKAGIEDVGILESKTEALGEKLLRPGCCLVMGDLWPPSILVGEDTLRLIDWEFCHYGHPLQDVAHFAAHCWMRDHVESHPKKPFKNLWDCFWEEYQDVWGATFNEIIDDGEMDDIATHIGAEILIRTVGPFKDGYVYQSFSNEVHLIQEAIQKAKHVIVADDFVQLWD